MGKIKTTIFVAVGLLLIVFIIPNVLYKETSPMCIFVGIIGIFVALFPLAANVVKKSHGGTIKYWR